MLFSIVRDFLNAAIDGFFKAIYLAYASGQPCPPIEAYSEGLLDEQLDTSAQIFINATTEISKENNTISVSKIFRWYRKDFAPATPDPLRFIGNYLYDRETGEWLRNNAEPLVVHYTPYDWRLNR